MEYMVEPSWLKYQSWMSHVSLETTEDQLHELSGGTEFQAVDSAIRRIQNIKRIGKICSRKSYIDVYELNKKDVTGIPFVAIVNTKPKNISMSLLKDPQWIGTQPLSIVFYRFIPDGYCVEWFKDNGFIIYNHKY